MEFTDHVVLVTGAGGRIGRAICRQFAAAGAKVACCDIDPGRASSIAPASYVNGAILNVTGGAHPGRPHLPPSRRVVSRR
ncbi:MAG: SDR family NAD(P)-dependent oxidoreductase [bacterium]